MSDRSKRDQRQVHVPAPTAGGSNGPPSRPPRAPSAPVAPRGSVAAPPRPAPGSMPPGRVAVPRPDAAPQPDRAPGGRRQRLLPHRPKLRRVLLLLPIVLPVLLLLAVVGGYLYAKSVFDGIDRVEVADVLSHGGDGTNYLIVGSDSRDPADLEGAGLNPDAFKDGGGHRSDTMLVVRMAKGGPQMLSIPRDLYGPIADTNGSAKINAAYNGGPSRLIKTIQQDLDIPIHHYLEVDFVAFAKLVDALGGITIDFPNPAFDTNTGLDIRQAGPNHLDGPQALAFVRSRHYVEIVDGKREPDNTGDLGRVARQQQFLTTVLSKLGASKNPLTLAKAAKSASGGLRIDDSLGLLDAMRLGWKLRGLHPTSIVLPTRLGSNSAGSVLFLVHPDADQVLAGFK